MVAAVAHADLPIRLEATRMLSHLCFESEPRTKTTLMPLPPLATGREIGRAHV